MTDQDFIDVGSNTESFSGYVQQSTEWVDNIFLLLFELKRKYGRSIREKIIVNINESEADRAMISDAYLYLQTEQENLLDSAVYEDFIRMSDLREKSLLEKMLYPEQRLEKFANTIRKSSTPIIYFSRLSDASITGLFQDLNEAVIEIGTSEDLDLFLKKYQKFFTRLNSHFLERGDILNIEERIKQKLINKRINKNDLDKLLTTLEAEILSKMISEKKIVVLQEKDILIFSTAKNNENIEGISSSLLLSPKLKNNESDKNG